MPGIIVRRGTLCLLQQRVHLVQQLSRKSSDAAVRHSRETGLDLSEEPAAAAEAPEQPRVLPGEAGRQQSLLSEQKTPAGQATALHRRLRPRENRVAT